MDEWTINLHSIFLELTHTRWSDGAPELDGAVKAVVRAKILHYRQVDLLESLSWLLESTLQSVSTMTSVVFYFWILIVNHRSWLMNYQKKARIQPKRVKEFEYNSETCLFLRKTFSWTVILMRFGLEKCHRITTQTTRDGPWYGLGTSVRQVKPNRSPKLLRFPRNDMKLFFGYWLIWLCCIIGFLGLIIKTFDNQTESWAWLSSPLIIKLFEMLDDNHDYFVYKTFTYKYHNHRLRLGFVH
jgi:hypothetical protein